MSKLADCLKNALEAYTGRPVKSIQVKADPQVERTYAARAIMEKGDTVDFIVSAGDQEQSLHAMTAEAVGDLIEEAQFKTWPPKSGPLRFF